MSMTWRQANGSEFHLLIENPVCGVVSKAEVYQLAKGRNKGMWRGYVEVGPTIIAHIHKTLEGIKDLCEVDFIRGHLIGYAHGEDSGEGRDP